jgi:hypothetical protein
MEIFCGPAGTNQSKNLRDNSKKYPQRLSLVLVKTAGKDLLQSGRLS